MLTFRKAGDAVLSLVLAALSLGASPAKQSTDDADVDEAKCPIGKVLPSVDDVQGKADLEAGLNKLRSAVANRDVAALQAMLKDKILFSFDEGESGKAGFLRQWRLVGSLVDPANSDLWQEMGTALGRGGGWVGNTYCFPRAYAAWPDECDFSDYALVVRDGVTFYHGPNRHSPVMGQLQAEIVRVPAGLDGAWVQIINKDGHKGYVEQSDLAQAVGYRGCMEKDKGSWRLQSFVAGD